MVAAVVLHCVRVAGRASAHLARRAQRNRGRHRQHHVEEAAIVRAVEEHPERSVRLGHHYNARDQRVLLLHHRQPIADVHEVYPAL